MHAVCEAVIRLINILVLSLHPQPGGNNTGFHVFICITFSCIVAHQKKKEKLQTLSHNNPQFSPYLLGHFLCDRLHFYEHNLHYAPALATKKGLCKMKQFGGKQSTGMAN